ncbi:MAG TPA: histidine phosphatase family protein [Mycobacteriales bacterium]|nr:histidine phosphatase family protein [Mycobacteriales bacterium]
MTTGRIRRVVLLRHGRTEWNATGRFQGQLDAPLDVMGKAQAIAAAVAVAPMQPDAIVSSDLGRTADTAAAVAAETGLDVVLDPRLREINLGLWQGLTRAEARERFPEEYEGWQAGEDRRRGDGETYAEVGARASECVIEWLDRLGAGATLLAVTHGGTARATIGTMLGFDPDLYWRLAPLGNCRWSLLADIGRGWRLEEHNAGSPPEEETGDDAR